MKVYHWTTKRFAKKILKTGLRKWSFMCRRPEDWYGEVCLKIDSPYIDWENRDDHAKWQALSHEWISPRCIKIARRRRERLVTRPG